MKLKITLIFTLILFTQLAFCQVPNVVEGSTWKEVRCNYWTGVWLGIYHVDNWRIEGDTIHNGKVYKKIYNYQEDFLHGIINGMPEDSLVSAADHFYGGIREENQVVYMWTNDLYDPVPLTERLIFDYSASVGDTLSIWCRFYYLDYIVDDIVPVVLNDGNTRKKFTLRPPGPGMVDMHFTEGIGSSYGFIGSYIATTNDQMQHLLCFSINDKVILENTPEYTSNCVFEPIQQSCNSVIMSAESTIHPAESLLVFPNPASTALQINALRSQWSDLTYSLYSATGSSIITGKSANSKTHRINVSMLPAGIYFLQIMLDNSEIVVKKVVIEK